MGYTLHINVDYPDNHCDWFHVQDDKGVGIVNGFRPFGPFETLAARAEWLSADAQAALDAAGEQGVLFD